MITLVMTIDTHAQLKNGQPGITLFAGFRHHKDDRPAMVELATAVMDKFQEAMKQGAAQSKEGLHYEEFIYPPQEDDAPANVLPADLAAALEVAKGQFTGMEQLVLHSPRDIAEVHLATVLRDYAASLRHTIHQMGASAAQVLGMLQDELERADEDAGEVYLKMDTGTYREMVGILEMMIAADPRPPTE